MDAQQFIGEFRHIANAPGGVGRLRGLVLQLAISGRLTEEKAGDVSAGELIKRNQSLQRELISRRELKRQPAPRPVAEAKIPWKLPTSWRWTRLGAVTNYGDALKVGYSDVGEHTWVLELEDVEKGTSKLLTRVLAKDRKFKSTKNGFPAGAVLYGKLRPYLDKVLIADSPGVCTTEINPISFFDGIAAAYLRWYLKSPYFIAYASGSTHGMNLPRLGTDSVREALFPFPPKEDQGRIVAKVDELMALCDKLETQQQERRKLQNAVRQSSLHAVANAQSPHELRLAWARLETNFWQLFTQPEDVDQFKGMVLDLAVTGQLLPPEQHAASSGAELLAAIEAKRVKWASNATDQEKKEAHTMLKKLRTHTVTQPIDQLPRHWSWASLLQISQALVDCHNKTAPYVSDGVHLVRTTDIRNGRMDLTNTKKISQETYEYWARRMPPRPGDIFFTREAPMGEAAIVPEGEKVCLGQRTMLIRLFPALFSNRFLLYVILSPSFQARMIEAAIGMTVKHLRVGGVENLMVPVPPKFEQDLIAEQVEHLFQGCDSYAVQLGKRQKLAANFAISSVANLAGFSGEQEEEDFVKAPETELIAPLRLGQSPDVKAQAPLATLLIRHNGEMSATDLWQRFGGEIDAFYAQLKTEVAHGWIQEPVVAEVREKADDTARV
ncbi:restriction endonuclease subunit S [Candidatus Nitrospira neomarina]|uniref:Restriction endonuclease subunit S n=1 Tax=Candidatus Nitrospira neomarina TaxID=3020899 RepID=A0AA96GJF0_9BACT|nr:restriction endonuclease subunit S [Candidatus Nitrospira neomarina]WNM63549.1 restriction endonuclease subunit S [Candidatus Nitrospira neomarina]